MALQDRNMDWMRKRLWIPPWYMGGLGSDGTNGVTLVADLESNDQVWLELSSFGYGAVKFTADNKLISGFIPCPYDLDPKFPVGFAIHWTAVSTGSTCEVTWLLLQNAVNRGIVLAKATAALDTILVSDPTTTDKDVASATDLLYQVTERGVRNDIGLTRAQIEEGAMITLNLEQASATAETNIYYIGMMMDYVPQLCQGIGKEADAPLSSV